MLILYTTVTPFIARAIPELLFLPWRVNKGPHNAPQEPYSFKVVYFNPP